MAISSSKFVGVNSTALIERAVARDLSGLVISKGTAKDTTKGVGKDYDEGKVVSVNANTLGDLFASTSAEFAWATKYFSYVSKSGTTPARLKFKKLGTTEDAVDAFKDAIGGSETFGSFTFLSGAATGEADATKLKACATHNAGLNYAYRMVVDYSQDEEADNYYGNYVSNSGGTVSGDLWGISGLTLCDGCSFLTMARLAATDYTGTNTTSCDMFKSVGGVEATVTDDATYDTLTAMNLNFVGLVKEHGNQWNWYMRGFNMDGLDSAVYDNEVWFKSEIVKDLLNLEDELEKIPANEKGLSMVNVTIQDSITMALRNGTILPGKPISAEKRTAILQQLDGDAEQLDQLLTKGYVLMLELAVDGEEYKINYKIAYLKGDSVRFIGGQHVIA